MSKPVRSPESTLAASVAFLAGVTALTYSHLGFLGVALVWLTDRFWEIANIVALVEAADAPAKKRGTYKNSPPVVESEP